MDLQLFILLFVAGTQGLLLWALWHREPVKAEPAAIVLPHVTPAPRPAWTRTDIKAWADFLASPTGQRFYEQLIYKEGGVFVEAVFGDRSQPGAAPDFLRGRAAGYRDLFRDLDTLATPAAYAGPIEPEETEQSPGT